MWRSSRLQLLDLENRHVPVLRVRLRKPKYNRFSVYWRLLISDEYDAKSFNPQPTARKVSISNAPDRGLECNGWFDLQSHQKYHVLAFIKLAARAAIVPVP